MHDDGDWDSELGSALIETLAEVGVGGWVGLIVLLAGLGLLMWHHFGG